MDFGGRGRRSRPKSLLQNCRGTGSLPGKARGQVHRGTFALYLNGHKRHKNGNRQVSNLILCRLCFLWLSLVHCSLCSRSFSGTSQGTGHSPDKSALCRIVETRFRISQMALLPAPGRSNQPFLCRTSIGDGNLVSETGHPDRLTDRVAPACLPRSRNRRGPFRQHRRPLEPGMDSHRSAGPASAPPLSGRGRLFRTARNPFDVSLGRSAWRGVSGDSQGARAGGSRRALVRLRRHRGNRARPPERGGAQARRDAPVGRRGQAGPVARPADSGGSGRPTGPPQPEGDHAPRPIPSPDLSRARRARPSGEAFFPRSALRGRALARVAPGGSRDPRAACRGGLLRLQRCRGRAVAVRGALAGALGYGYYTLRVRRELVQPRQRPQAGFQTSRCPIPN